MAGSFVTVRYSDRQKMKIAPENLFCQFWCNVDVQFHVCMEFFFSIRLLFSTGFRTLSALKCAKVKSKYVFPLCRAELKNGSEVEDIQSLLH